MFEGKLLEVYEKLNKGEYHSTLTYPNHTDIFNKHMSELEGLVGSARLIKENVLLDRIADEYQKSITDFENDKKSKLVKFKYEISEALGIHEHKHLQLFWETVRHLVEPGQRDKPNSALMFAARKLSPLLTV